MFECELFVTSLSSISPLKNKSGTEWQLIFEQKKLNLLLHFFAENTCSDVLEAYCSQRFNHYFFCRFIRTQ